MNQDWTLSSMPNLQGKIAIVTGANVGLGLESVKALASKGAQVVMACRNLAKAEVALKSVLSAHPEANVEVMHIDNANLKSVASFAQLFKNKYDKLDILMNNAGVMAIPRTLTDDGFEMQFGTNHLGHFALTGHLNEVLERTPGSRVHCTSSSAAFSGKINFDDLMGESNYSRWAAYGQSKLANAVFATELNHRFEVNQQQTIANSSHPGFVMGNLQLESLAQSNAPLLERVGYKVAGALIGQDNETGMLPQLYGATAQEAKGGLFYGPKKFRMIGSPAEQQCNTALQDQALLKRFWEVSQSLTGISYL